MTRSAFAKARAWACAKAFSSAIPSLETPTALDSSESKMDYLSASTMTASLRVSWKARALVCAMVSLMDLQMGTKSVPSMGLHWLDNLKEFDSGHLLLDLKWVMSLVNRLVILLVTLMG